MKKRNFNYLLFIGLFSLALASCSNSNNNSSSNNGSISTINKSNIISSADTDFSVSDDVEEYDFENISDGGSYTLTVGSNSYSITMSSLLYSNGSSGGNHGGNPGGGNPFGPRF